MSTTHLSTYLNDHLAGAMVAVELLEHLEKTHTGTDLQQFAASLHAEVEADRQELSRLMDQLGVVQSRTRQAGAWVTEKLTRLKLRFDDPAAGDFLVFEILEVLSVGIEGKAVLWKSVATAAEASQALRVADYGKLLQRARDQRELVEGRRVALARRTLVPGD